MSYQVLARKYRPSIFAELEGQEHVLRALINALELNRLHHAYLFAGTRGVGKTTIARILAKCLNCEVGITATPCGECATCQEIRQGRCVDLIEIDAASRTGVDDMRELLDNVQYMPTCSRFKIYLIDEVHMLSKSSFNAMLKTLEEPPEHVKFLFATTDPKKLPVTVLSRCLQFNLKNLSPERIVSYLEQLLPREEIKFETSALWQIGRAADGSMRDALSLTDQAISYSDNFLTGDAVQSMLGNIDQREVYELIDALIAEDGARLLAKIDEIAQFAPDYSGLLDDLLAVLHRIAVAHAVPEGIDNSQGDRELVLAVANSISREDGQLFYQIGLIGKRDLPLAPDPRSGFEMILLRMLAFTTTDGQSSAGSSGNTGGKVSGESPVASLLARIGDSEEEGRSADTPRAEPVSGPVTEDNDQGTSSQSSSFQSSSLQSSSLQVSSSPSNPESAVTRTPESVKTVEKPTSTDTGTVGETGLSENWVDILGKLNLSGVTQTLAANCTLSRCENGHYYLLLNEHHATLWNKTHETRISQALAILYGHEIGVSIEVGIIEAETPAELDRRQQQEIQAKAVKAIEEDRNIQELIQNFNGTIDRDSISPVPQTGDSQ
ncbi:MAG: DNA polymerase III subunit gamma/tau [Gammaproteobacteria bacterium]|jgi:DNA polymerase-3 subunit gamma/tau|nr:DNA polymerase III subunit gamma/tau [Gammaproteobacteria bacterium]|tara:strand:+ start:33 stop:1856 length:1824 start_codon:yes stop_codon:yes gene_type:complete